MADSVHLKPYDGTTDFSLWRAKMKAILIKEKCYRAVTQEWLDPTSAEKRKEISDIAHSEIMIRLSDEVLRQVVNISEPKELWDTIESIYLTKSLPSRISLLSSLFNFRMNTSLSIQENLDTFLKMTHDLSSCKDKIEETHKAVILLNSLPPQFDIVKDVIQYGRDEITLAKITEVIVQKNESLKGTNRNDHKSKSKNEVMMFKGKPKQKHKKKTPAAPAKSNSDGNEKTNFRPLSQVKCFYCGKNDHYANTCTKK
ncbi:unnamed protein product [Rhodiola kirilowii]